MTRGAHCPERGEHTEDRHHKKRNKHIRYEDNLGAQRAARRLLTTSIRTGMNLAIPNSSFADLLFKVMTFSIRQVAGGTARVVQLHHKRITNTTFACFSSLSNTSMVGEDFINDGKLSSCLQPIRILYATQSGTAKMFAHQLADDVRESTNGNSEISILFHLLLALFSFFSLALAWQIL